MPKNLAIVPAFNEEASVGSVVRDLHEFAPGFDVLVVDDGSTDATSSAAREAGANAVLRMPFNLGIGGTVQAGYQYALEHGYDFAIQVDGDGQHEAREVPKLLEYLRSHPDVDMVTGSRFLECEDGQFVSTRSRRLGIRIFGGILSAITRQKVTDPTSGFRMCNRRGIELFARDYPHDYPEVEAVLMIHSHRLRSAEVPVRMRARTTGVSSINASRSLYYMIKVTLAIVVGLFRARPAIERGEQPPVAAEHSI
jgi:glycosyltransferase involved in cell wall biosynthesis